MSIKPAQDSPSVNASGSPLTPLPQGVTFREAPTHIDDRGFIVEAFDSRWAWHPDPLVFSYVLGIRPGMIKGWGMHKLHEDRYFILFGDMMVVMYDDRPDSPTRGLVAKVVLSESNRRLMNIPAGVWHANWNIGNKDVVVVNFPTMPYQHDNPDKYRLPLDTDLIPFRFENAHGY